MASSEYPDPSVNPFTDGDLEKLLHDEKSSSRDEGWKFVRKDDEVEVWQKQDPEKPVHLIKGFLNFKDIPPKAVADIVHDVESRCKWDKLFSIIEVLDSYENHRIVYWFSKMPIAVSDRDIVQKICTRRDESTDSTFILYYHTTHPAKPPISGIVRAETIRSGVIIRPHPDLPNSTRMSLLFQTDMKGWIPHFVVNALAAKAPGSWHENLRTYFENDYSKKNEEN